MITGESIEKLCGEVDEYSDERMSAEFERFFRAQPAVCEFVSELTNESDFSVKEMTLFLSYMAFRLIESAKPGVTPPIAPEELEAAFRETELWAHAANEPSPQAEGAHSLPMHIQEDPEPFLLQYAIRQINAPLEDGSQLPDEDKGEIFFLVKTVISSLTKR